MFFVIYVSIRQSRRHAMMMPLLPFSMIIFLRHAEAASASLIFFHDCQLIIDFRHATVITYGQMTMWSMLNGQCRWGAGKC